MPRLVSAPPASLFPSGSYALAHSATLQSLPHCGSYDRQCVYLISVYNNGINCWEEVLRQSKYVYYIAGSTRRGRSQTVNMYIIKLKRSILEVRIHLQQFKSVSDSGSWNRCKLYFLKYNRHKDYNLHSKVNISIEFIELYPYMLMGHYIKNFN